ncbi:transketolase [Arthrobacter sp. MW3 TE3886]|uniref:transketolase n=1 Tax=Arthrobacter sp. MW3 TE3886 TaxID=3156254 RepID=UPI00351618CC
MSKLEQRELELLEETARQGRWHVIRTVAAAKAGHIGGPLSAMDLLVALYFRQLRINPDQPDDPDRDRFILSKGHCAVGLYAVLALRGYFPVEELETFDHGDSRLQGHPDMKLTPGVDASTGSLGQGLSAGVGIALGANRLGKDFHTWVMLGDGELVEGMVWEAVYSAQRFGLGNLTAVVDVNGLQQYGWPSASPDDRGDRSEPWSGVDLGAVFGGFGWNVLEVDGHSFPAIVDTLERAQSLHNSGRPTVILARTIKGKGISFTEGTYKWHNGVASAEQLELAATELKQNTEGALR